MFSTRLVAGTLRLRSGHDVLHGVDKRVAVDGAARGVEVRRVASAGRWPRRSAALGTTAPRMAK